MSSKRVPEEFRISDEAWKEIIADSPAGEDEQEITKESIEKEIFLDSLELELHEDFELQLAFHELIKARRKQ